MGEEKVKRGSVNFITKQIFETRRKVEAIVTAAIIGAILGAILFPLDNFLYERKIDDGGWGLLLAIPVMAIGDAVFGEISNSDYDVICSLMFSVVFASIVFYWQFIIKGKRDDSE